MMGRRAFLAGAAAGPIEFDDARKKFPRAVKETYFNAAAQHPLGLHALRGMQRYLDFMSQGWTGGLHDFREEGFLQVRSTFARLIKAKPSEIAFTGSTTIGENTLVNQLRRELPPLGHTGITPAGTETPIITFLSHNIEATRAKIVAANRTGRAHISITGPNSALTAGRFGNHVRFSISVYNNDHDVDKILEVLS